MTRARAASVLFNHHLLREKAAEARRLYQAAGYGETGDHEGSPIVRAKNETAERFDESTAHIIGLMVKGAANEG